MLVDQIQNALASDISHEICRTEMEGNHLTVLLVSEIFEGLNKVKRQQTIYKVLNSWIASGEVHAVNIMAHTPEEWQTLNDRGF
ncbi:MAG: BolA/IbaG family iron-sulfur metabolism protein [Pseudomonadota bacterium]|nr:BolA/IbaG family iron-sulfur metabolism protein [Pseudomonadota bacterium]